MTDEERAQFEEMIRKVNELYAFMEATKNGVLPMNDNYRITAGIGFVGRTGDTTPGGAIIVNTPQGPIKILTV